MDPTLDRVSELRACYPTICYTYIKIKSERSVTPGSEENFFAPRRVVRKSIKQEETFTKKIVRRL